MMRAISALNPASPVLTTLIFILRITIPRAKSPSDEAKDLSSRASARDLKKDFSLSVEMTKRLPSRFCVFARDNPFLVGDSAALSRWW
jgi:hypothetical protein